MKQIIDPILAPHIIASVEKKASEKLHELILEMNQPITIIDEVTGGVLQTLVLKPGIQHLLNFNGMIKTKIFFQLNGLEEYWNQQTPKGKTQLTIHYSNQNQEGGETHEIPFRSPLVILYAAEWLSYRLFHIINQLH